MLLLCSQAVFTREKGSFRSVLVRAHFNEDKYRLSLEDEGVRRAFALLQAHTCTRCQPARTFPVFKQLADHMLRQHQLQYCELCVKHLKVGGAWAGRRACDGCTPSPSPQPVVRGVLEHGEGALGHALPERQTRPLL